MKTNENSNVKLKGAMPIVAIIASAVIIIVVVLGIFLLKPADKAVAGQATYVSYAAQTGVNDWGFGITQAEGGTYTNLYDGEIIDVPIFVNFGVAPGKKFFIGRMELDYNSAVLEPVTVTHNLGGAYGPAPDQTGVLKNTIYDFGTKGKIKIEVFTSSSDAAAVTHIGQKNVFIVKFKVIAPEPEQNLNQIYAGAISLVSINDLPNVNTDNGFFGENDVQLLNQNPTPLSVDVSAIPPCYDTDKDKYGKTGTDQRACLKKGDDCDDLALKVNPAGKEICNGIDDNCAGGIDENLPLEFNDLPAGKDKLQGVCLGYKVCQNGAPKNSYDTDVNYNPSDDACDFYDNDCDGILNKGDPACKLGGISKVGTISSQIPGNAYIDYDIITNKHKDPQALTDDDVGLVGILKVVYGENNCGSNGQKPCPHSILGVSSWVCREGVYYQEFNNQIYKFSPSGDLEITTLTPVGLNNGNVVCG